MWRNVQQPGAIGGEDSEAQLQLQISEAVDITYPKRSRVSGEYSKRASKTASLSGSTGKGGFASNPDFDDFDDHAAPASKSVRNELIVGIDLGTTFSGAAYGSTVSFDPQRVKVVTDWPSGARSTDVLEKCPSRIALASENEGLSENKWGYEVAPGMNQHTWFKLLLDNHVIPTDYDDGFLQSGNQEGILQLPRGIGAEELVTEYLKCLYQHLMLKLEKVLTRDALAEQPIKFWFTSPATWSERANASTRKAAESAGFGKRRGDKILMIPEPEAAATAILTSRAEEQPGIYKIGQYVLVVDIGGGTTDLSLLQITKVDPLKMDEGAIGIGGKYGSTTIDRMLIAKLGEELGTPFTDLPNNKIGPGSRFMDNFELVKKNFDGSNLEKRFTLQLPALGQRLKSVAPNSGRYDFEDGEVVITGEELAEMFDVVIQNALRLTKQQIGALSSEQKIDLKFIAICGGMGTSPYVWKRFNDYCMNDLEGKVLLQTDEHAWSAVVRGAVMRGLQGSIVISKYARRWYGICVHRKFQQWDNPHESFVCPLLGKRAPGYFDCQIKKGERYKEKMVKRLKVYVAIDDQVRDPVQTWRLYSSNRDKMPSRVDEEGVEEVGHLKVDLSDFISQVRKSRKTSSGNDVPETMGVRISVNLKMGTARGTFDVQAMYHNKSIGAATIEYGAHN